MNLKEAASYGAFLNNMIIKSQRLANSEIYCRKTTEYHNINKTNPDGVNEVINIEQQDKMDIKCHMLIDLSKKLIEEKLYLNMAIEKAKSKLFIDWKEDNKKLSLDNAISYNKQLRDLISSCDYLKNVKTVETKKMQYGYKFNVEGNQVPYQYEVITRQEIDFNKDAVLNLNKSLKEKTDRISILIDLAQTKDVIDFTPKFSKHDTIEEVVESFLNR